MSFTLIPKGTGGAGPRTPKNVGRYESSDLFRVSRKPSGNSRKNRGEIVYLPRHLFGKIPAPFTGQINSNQTFDMATDPSTPDEFVLVPRNDGNGYSLSVMLSGRKYDRRRKEAESKNPATVIGRQMIRSSTGWGLRAGFYTWDVTRMDLGFGPQPVVHATRYAELSGVLLGR